MFIQLKVRFMPEEDYIQVALIESHPRSVGQSKRFAGVAGNLMAFAAKLSFEVGNDGCIAFDAKTELIDHYAKTLGARRVGKSQRRVVFPIDATKLIQQYCGGHHGIDS